MADRPLLTQPRFLIGAVVIVALATTGYFTLAAFLELPPFPGTPDVRSDFQVVLDRSTGMEDPFDGGTTTKLDAAIQAINEEVLPVQVADTDLLALRQYGGPCQGDNSRQIVEFGRDNKDTVRDALGTITIDGTSTFADGVAAAIEDLNDPSRFRNAFNSILVFTGSGDACDLGSAPMIINEQLKKLEDQGIYVNLTFIGLDLPADQLGFGEARFIDVGSLGQLRSELNQLMAELQAGRDRWLEASESDKAAILESLGTREIVVSEAGFPTPQPTPTAIPDGRDNPTPIPQFELVLPEFVAPGQVVNLSAGVASNGAGGGGSAGDQSPYTYSIQENNSGASIDSTTGEYTAGPNTGVTDIVAVTDGNGEVVRAELNVVEVPDIQLPRPLVASGSNLTIGATGGLPPYTFSIPDNSSGASIDPVTGEYTAGTTTGVTDIVAVTDARGLVISARVEVVESPALLLPRPILTPGAVQIIEAIGGLPPYTYSISDNQSGASIDPITGEYTAGATTGATDVVAVTDANGIETQELVEVVEPPLIVLQRPILAPDTAQIVEVTGGLPPYTYSILDNQSGASMDPITGEYTAGPTTGVTDTVAVTDANGIETQELVEVVEPPLIVLRRPFLTSNFGQIIEAIAGQPPYTFSFLENNSGASIDPITGEYRAGAITGVTDIVEVTDSRGISAQESVDVVDSSDDDRSDREANLDLSQEIDNAIPNEGDSITFTLTLNNEGPRGAAGIVVTDILPAGVTFVSADPSYDVETGQWTVGSLASGSNATLAIAVTVEIGTCASTITNPAQITAASQADPEPLNNSASVTFTVQCPPVLTPQTFTVDENSPNGTIVGTVVATDLDAGDSLTFSISGDSQGQPFSIDAATGQITVADSPRLDFETTPSFSLEVQVSDLGGNSASATMTVILNDLFDEDPVLTPQTFTVDESSPNGTIVGSVDATDSDAADSLIFSISGGSGETAFSIDAATGQITVAEVSQLDFETTPSFSLEVQVSDLGGNSASDTMTINLNDIVIVD